MGDYLQLDGCRMAFLQQQLDDPPTGPCGICDNCAGRRFGHDPEVAVIAEASDQLLHSHIEVEPRRQWPTGLGEPSGKIPEAERAEPGWCLASWGGAGWGELIRDGKQTSGRFDDRLVDALAELVREKVGLSNLGWLTSVPSRRHPELVSDLAARLGTRLGLPVADVVVVDRATEPQKTMQNSAQQVHNVWGAFGVNGELPPGGCLLVDDIIDSRWTTTVIAALLRRAGAEHVTPVALASAAGSDG